MRRWLTGLALAMTAPAALAQNVQVQVQQKVQVDPVQVQPAQVQPLPPNAAVARMIARPGIMPVVQQGMLVRADAVVVGRVIGMEPMDIQASPAANQPNANYRIAVVQLSDVLHGVQKDSKMVRVGFVAAPMNGDPNAGGINGIQIQIQPAIAPAPGFIGRPYYGNVNLQVGQDGLFMLTKHHKENFYVMQSYANFITRQNNPNFEKEVENAKLLGKVLEDPTAALKSDDRQQRYLAAAVLIGKYRSNPTGQPTKQVPIDAAESKLILKALATSDWNVNRTSAALPTSQELFNQIGITATDGYKLVNVRNQQDINTAMQKWLDAHADQYVIKKLVVDPDAKVQPGERTPIRPLPIKKLGKGQILPVPAPLPAPVEPIELELPVQPAQPQPAPLPLRRE